MERCFMFLSMSLLTILLHGCGTTPAPSPSPPPPPATPRTIAEYTAARSKLVAANSARSFDASMTLTTLEQEVDVHLASMRDSYIRRTKLDGTYAPSTYFPLWNKTEIKLESTFKFLDGLPKGADLHTHSGSTGSVDWFLDEGMEMEGCYVYWPSGGPCVESDDDPLIGTVGFYNVSSIPSCYFPGADLNKDPEFKTTWRSLITATAALADMDSIRAWEVFSDIFARTGAAMAHRPFYLGYLQNSFENLFNNGITHMEMRALVGANGLGDMTDLHGNRWSGRDVITTYQEALKTFQSSLPSRAHFTLKLIASDLRTATPEHFMKDLDVIIDLHEEFPDFVVGLDSVSEEDINHRTLEYVPTLLQADARIRERNVTLNLYLHDGESQDRNDTNMIDAVMLDCPRVGHAINTASFFPAVREEMKTKGTVLEINPISNQILRYVESIETHPGAALAFDGVNIVIANDDPMCFDYTGVTWDWWAVTIAWHLDLKSLKTLAKNSLLFSAMNSTEKAAAVQRWEQDWQAYMELFAQETGIVVSLVV